MKLKAVLVLLALLCSSQQVYADCWNEVENDTELNLLRGKVALVGSGAQTFSMLANESYPTSDEKQVIYKWALKREQCVNSQPQPNNPVEQINRSAFNDGQSLILELYKGIITYGQFANKRQEIKMLADAKAQAFIGQYQQQQVQQQQQQRQFCESRYQQCLNRAGDIYARNACQMEHSGCALGGMLSR